MKTTTLSDAALNTIRALRGETAKERATPVHAGSLKSLTEKGLVVDRKPTVEALALADRAAYEAWRAEGLKLRAARKIAIEYFSRTGEIIDQAELEALVKAL